MADPLPPPDEVLTLPAAVLAGLAEQHRAQKAHEWSCTLLAWFRDHLAPLSRTRTNLRGLARETGLDENEARHGLAKLLAGAHVDADPDLSADDGTVFRAVCAGGKPFNPLTAEPDEQFEWQVDWDLYHQHHFRVVIADGDAVAT
jgi:hypothetical protein